MQYEDDQEAQEARRRAQTEARERAERLYAGDWLGGRLLAHGKAKYHNDPAESDSYYIKLQTNYGPQILWGVDLERAVRESKSHVNVGDAVGVRITYREQLGVNRTFNHWQIDKAIYIVKERRIAREILENPLTARRAGKDGATLTGSYLLITAAEMLARVQYPDEASRQRFVERVREAAGMEAKPFDERRQKEESVRKTNGLETPTMPPHRSGFTRE